jgi:hypothetical protein
LWPFREGDEPFAVAFRLSQIRIGHADLLSKIFDGQATRTDLKLLTGLLGLSESPLGIKNLPESLQADRKWFRYH